MYTEHDERRGLVKTTWNKVRDRVHKVNPEFASLVDEVDPGNDMPLFLAYYPYGYITSDIVSPILPKNNGGEYRLSISETPKEVFKHLGYGADGSLLTMILDKSTEVFISKENATIPLFVFYPGDMYALGRLFNIKNNKVHTPNSILNFSAGTRSTFMLPYIGCTTHHANLKRDYNIQTSVAKNHYDHWRLFKEISNHPDVKCDWRNCLLYFSDSWINKILNCKNWRDVKLFLYTYEWNKMIHKRNKIYYDYIFSVILEERNLKPNPYLIDIARYLLKIAAGDSIGFEPATNDSSLPFNLLQNIFINSYGLSKYIPTIMIANIYDYETNKYPIYYSFQYPILDNFSPKSRRESTAIFEIRELAHIIKALSEGLSQKNSLCSDTFMFDLAKRLKFHYYHNTEDHQNIIKLSSEITKFDNRFLLTSNSNSKNRKSILASDAKFLRGCISISTQH